jgi:tetraacyldisaccharide 4'-kinase
MADGERRQESALERIWFGNDLAAKVARLLLMPLEGVYGSVIGVREALYDTGLLRTRAPVLPTISIGNLSVGGTGKTPVAAWIARGIVERGGRPAIVLRGYGDDEPRVHRMLNPDVPVVVAGDRVAGVAAAQERGASVAVLDDAFQHRRIERRADFVLVSADRWTRSPHLLPAGPWREPLRAVRRATLVLVTRKAASTKQADDVHEALLHIAPLVPRTTVHLAPLELVAVGTQQRRPIADLAGREVHILVAIGDPQAFVRQIEALAATVKADVHPDHHHFTGDEIDRFVRGVPPDGLAICTLKDAVKLADRWPREAPTLWYVSQHVTVERGVGGVERVLDELTRAQGATEP